MTNEEDNTNSTIKKTKNNSGVVMCTYVGNPIEIISRVAEKGIDEKKETTEEEDEDEDEEEDKLSVYGCCNSNCHSFGEEAAPCGRCGEDSSCFYLGDKLTMEQVKNAIERMMQEDGVGMQDNSDDEDE